MLVSDIIKVLNKSIPKKDSWVNESYGAGHHVHPAANVEKILFCVTATREVVEYFKDNKYDLLISHHPFPVSVPQLMYHTALDCCKDGLNDMWKNFLDVKDAKHFDRNLGWFGKIEPIKYEDLVRKIENWINHELIGICFSKKEIIESVCICTGLGGMVLQQAEKTNADCYVLGELTYPIRAEDTVFKSILEIGHTLTENIGVKLIRSLLPDVQVDLAPLEIDYFGNETSIRLPSKSNNSILFNEQDNLDSDLDLELEFRSVLP